MGILSSIFSGNSTAEKAVDAVINTGDKLFYTDEERAEMKLKTADMHMKMLGAYAPFKLAQRLIALTLISAYLFVHLVAVGFFIYGALEISEVMTRLAKDLFNINNDTLAIPVATIIAFYFMGGVAESFKRDGKQ